MGKPYIAQQPIDDFGQLISDIKYSATLPASTNTVWTIPGSYMRYKAIIRSRQNGIWMALNAAASVPAGPSFAQTQSELITDAKPICREVRAGDQLNFITSSANTDVSVVLYSLGSIAGI